MFTHKNNAITRVVISRVNSYKMYKNILLYFQMSQLHKNNDKSLHLELNRACKTNIKSSSYETLLLKVHNLYIEYEIIDTSAPHYWYRY